MRSLMRNRRQIWYANYLREDPAVNAAGKKTGEKIPVYSEPAPLLINVSAATGEATAEAFGTFTDYSRVLCTADVHCPVKESAKIWFDKSVEEPANYVVVRVADSLNGVLYALKEVTGA